MAGLNLLTPSGGYVNLSPTNTATNVSLNLPAANGSLISANTGSGAFTTSNFNSASTFGFRNRIINGDMRIDQRYGGSAFGTSINGYSLDRWVVQTSVTGKLNGSQNYNSITPPSGFSNYLGAVSQSAYTVGANDYFDFYQMIEGYNIADLAWGTANAKTVTLSFQVYSSLTGTFGGSLRNGAYNRSYPFTYTISSANTWTTVSVTIPGDTTGTWLTTNGIGIIVTFSLGMGSTYSGTAGSWSSNSYASATGATSVVATNGATFYLTGVQFEVGSVATPFDFRSYGQELALCQRYYTVLNGGGVSLQGFIPSGLSERQFYVYLKQSMRASPTTTATMSSGALTNTITGTDQIKFISTSGDFSISSWTASSEL